MNYKITKTHHDFNGKTYTDLVLTFDNGHKWVLVPLTKNDNKAAQSYFYALLNGTAK